MIKIIVKIFEIKHSSLRIALTEFLFIPEQIGAMKQSGLCSSGMMHVQAQIAMAGSNRRSVIAHRPRGISFYT